MVTGRGQGVVFAVVTVAATSLLGATPARADHLPDDPQSVEETAHTIPAQMHRMALFRVDYAPVENFQIGTSPLLLAPLFPNASMKWRFVNTEHVAISAGLSAAYLHTRILRKFITALPIADLVVVPGELTASFDVAEELSIHTGARFTGISVSGEYNADDFQGALALSNLQLHAMLEWKLHRHVALNLRARYVAFQTTEAGGEVNLEIDEQTSIRARAIAETDALDFPHAFQIVAGSHLSFTSFNAILGVGYGNLVVPIFNLVLPVRGLVPMFDLYWRF